MLNIHKELLIAQVGKYVERATPWFLVRPPLPPLSQKANPVAHTRGPHTCESSARNRENYGLLRTYCVQERESVYVKCSH